MRRVLAAAALVAVLAGLGAWAFAAPWSLQPSSSGLQPTAAALGTGLGVDSQRLAASPATLAHDPLDASRSVLLVVAPGHAFSAQDRDAAVAFVRGGGFLIVADDAGQANSLLAPFGLAFERVRLVEGTTGWAWSNADLPLDLPSPTAVLAGPDAEVLGSSSERSFLDRDASGAIDAADPAGPFPVAALLREGNGAVLAVADADAFRGAALAGNVRWLKDVLAEVQPDASLVLVADPAAAEDPVLFGLAWMRTTAAGVLRPALLAVTVLAVAALGIGTVWAPWHAHRFRPLHFRRRADATVAEPPAAGLTERGAVAVLAAPALVVLWALTGSAEAAVVAALTLVALGLAGLAQVPRLKGTRQLSTEATVEGTAVEVAVEVRASGAATLELRDTLPLEAEVAAGSSWGLASVGRRPLRIAYTLNPALRGKLMVGPLRARRHDPLGLRSSEAVVAEAQPLMVRPRAEPAGRTPMATRRPMATLGTHRVNRAGDGTEFHALRGYQAGDSFRSVNWKASARSKELMVNQRVHESMTCLTLLLDARQIAAAGPAARSPFARSCRAALSIAVGATRMRDRLRIVVYGDGVQEIPPGASARQIHEFTQMLSQLTPAGSTTLEEAIQQVMPSLRPGMPLMVLSGLEADPTAADALAALPPRGIRPIVVAPPPLTVPVDAEDGAAEADAKRIEAEHADNLARLRAGGITVYTMDADLPIDSIFQRGVAA